VILLAFELNGLFNDRNGDFQERRRCLDQLLVMDGTVAIFGKLLGLFAMFEASTSH
jgi:hypothetical protein